MKYNTPFHRGYRVKYVTLAMEPCIRVCGTLAETLRNIGGASAEGTRFLRGYVRMLPLKWHLQRSESKFCKKFQVFKTLI